MISDVRSDNVLRSSRTNFTPFVNEIVVTNIFPASLFDMPLPYGFDIVVSRNVAIGAMNY